VGVTDGLSLLFYEFYVPALILQLQGSEVALQLSESITFFSICCIYIYICPYHQQRGLGGRLEYQLYRVGTSKGTCGTSCISPSTVTLNVLLGRNELTSLIIPDEKYNLDSSCNKTWCQVTSKAFSISKNTTAIDKLILKFTRFRKPHALKCRAVTCNKGKLTCT
jgi:hypothetical protein